MKENGPIDANALVDLLARENFLKVMERRKTDNAKAKNDQKNYTKTMHGDLDGWTQCLTPNKPTDKIQSHYASLHTLAIQK